MLRRIAIYGNTLNMGCQLAELFKREGFETLVFLPPGDDQNFPEWWSAETNSASPVRSIPPIPIWKRGRLSNLQEIQELYAVASEYDVLILSEDGPAVFSELPNVKRVLYSNGFDIQNLPFQVSQRICLSAVSTYIRDQLRRLRSGDRSAITDLCKRIVLIVPHLFSIARVQRRQRDGLRQCSAFLLAPYNTEIAEKLKIDPAKIHYIPFPTDAESFSDVDTDSIERLRQLYGDLDLLFLHPTRQLYLKLDRDPNMKDNHKLLEAYARFVHQGTHTSRLLLVRKGREPDIQRTDELINSLGISAHCEWFLEIPNRFLRAYYALENVVVCDQFNQNLDVLGNVGREASCFGKPLITAFGRHNRLLFGDDAPPHIIPATSAIEIFEGMQNLAAMTKNERESLSGNAKNWFGRHYQPKSVLPKLIDILAGVTDSL